MALIRFQLRGDTAAAWAAANPVLANREPGVETDTGRMKVGDGVRAWNDVDYASKGDPGPAGEQGLPGVNAVPADEAVAGYVSSGGSQTNAALLGVIGRGQPNGTASLGADGMLPTSQIPAVAYGTVYPAASQAAMLALPATGGDVAARTDGAGSFMLKRNGNPATLADWVLLNAPTDAVVSVNGQAGTVNLGAADVSAVPTTRQVNGHTLSADVTLSAADVAALAVSDSRVPPIPTSANAGKVVTVATGGGYSLAAAGGGGSGSSLLGYATFAGGSINTTAGAAPTPVYSSILTATFTAPASGAVDVYLEGVTYVAANGILFWSLRSGAANIAGTERRVTESAVASRLGVRIRVTGLTPGNPYTYQWAWRSATAAGFLYGYVSGEFTAGNTTNYGPAVMEVWSA